MNIEEKVTGILCDLSGEKQIEFQALLQDDLALNSLAMVTMLVEIEDVFGVELDESDMNPFDLNTVQDVIKLVQKYCGDENG